MLPSVIYLFSSVAQLCLTLCNSMNCSMPCFPVHRPPPELIKFMSIESVMPSNHFILCRPLLLPTSIFPNIRVFSYESALRITWPKIWSFSFSISPSSEYSRLISFRMDWLDLVFQGTLKSLLQHHSLKASTLWRLAGRTKGHGLLFALLASLLWVPFSCSMLESAQKP